MKNKLMGLLTSFVMPGGTRDWTGTLYLLYQTLVCPSLITVSTYRIQKYKIKLPCSGVYSVIYIQS